MDNPQHSLWATCGSHTSPMQLNQLPVKNNIPVIYMHTRG